MTLFGVTGGGRVGDEGRAEITILANDKPYGTNVSLDESVIQTVEDEENSTDLVVPLTRK